MTHDLQHHGLIEVPLPGRASGIYWLRFYRGEPRCVAVLTEVPGNPTLSLVNAVSRISDFVARRFEVELTDLIIFQVWPKGAVGKPRVERVTFTDDGSEKTPWARESRDLAAAERARFTGRPKWWDSTKDAIEAIVGVPLESLPDHEELYAAVRALGGGTTQELWRRVFEAVDVDTLPPPHNPSKCRYAKRFVGIDRRLAKKGPVDELAAGREFLATLSPEECAKCEYHQADWRAVADESVRIVAALGRRDEEDYLEAVASSALAERERDWLETLFSDPVDIAGGSYTNGQHRGCALRFSGAQRAAVVTGDESLGEVVDDWTYEGQG